MIFYGPECLNRPQKSESMPPKYPRPPRFPEFIMRLFYPKRDAGYLDGDLREIYTDIHEERGRIAALCWY